MTPNIGVTRSAHRQFPSRRAVFEPTIYLYEWNVKNVKNVNGKLKQSSIEQSAMK